MHHNKGNRRFVSGRIEGGEMIIEVDRYNVDEKINKGKLKIEGFNYSFVNADVTTKDGFGASLPCQTNVICSPQWNNWCNQIRSVVQFIWFSSDGNSYSCSGTIVNNPFEDFRPLILTAAHCVHNGIDWDAWQYMFNYQSPTCTPNSYGNQLMLLTGSSVLTTSGDGLGDCPDVAVISLWDSIPLQYNVFYSGFDRRGFLDLPWDDNGVGIHHPMHDEKKFSTGSIVYPITDPCITVNWDPDNTIEKGSSGSPLFVSTKRIVGVASHYYNDNPPHCGSGNSCSYGWLNNAWPDIYSAFSPYIDLEYLDGIDPISACTPFIELNGPFYPGNDWQKKNQITIQASNTIWVANKGWVTNICNSPSPISPTSNSDYIIKAGHSITLFHGFSINALHRYIPYNYYAAYYDNGYQNRVSFQVGGSCVPFVNDCGFNFQESVEKRNNYFNFDNSQIATQNGGVVSSPGSLTPPELKLYPNPATQSVTLEYSDHFNYTMSDMTGKIILVGEKASDATVQINLVNLKPGIYIVKAFDDNSKQVKMLVKQ